MARFYKAMELDEQQQLKKNATATPTGEPFTAQITKRSSVDSIDRHLERKSSLRRRLSGEVPDINIDFSKKVFSSPETDIGSQPRSFYPQESLDDPDYMSHVDEYTDDYTESTASSDESETEKFKRRVREHGQPRPSMTDELNTYHPRNRMGSPYTSPESDQAAEVLSKPYSLPSPDFIPKPILKRPPSVESNPEESKQTKAKNSKAKKSFSKLFERKGSAGVSTEEAKGGEVTEAVVKLQEVVPVQPPTQNDLRRDSAINREKANKLKTEMRQSSIEEQKVAIDHYSDLVKEKANWRTATLPLYLNADDLKKAAEILNVDEETPPPAQIASTSVQENKKPKEFNGVLPHLQQTSAIEPAITNSTRSGQEDPNQLTRGRSNLKEATPSERSGSSVPSSSQQRGGSRSSSGVRKVGRTPVESRVASKARERSTSKSPLTVNRRPLALQKQNGEEMGENKKMNSRTPSRSRPVTPLEEEKQQQQQEEIDIKVKSTMNYTTDLVLFVVACWVYLFKDARLALPIVLLLIYRHIRDHLPTLPRWMVKRKSE